MTEFSIIAPFPYSGPWCLMCCGCGGFLGDSGQLVTIDPKAGVFNRTSVACFPDLATADQFGAAHGWAVSDDEGPNHRCPACVEKERAAELALRAANHAQQVDEGERRRGAYVRFDSLPL